jgi:DNA-directed RNA polymerase specialized sigma24 family protein
VFFEQHILRKNMWDPHRGATLRTFFIGACVRLFTNEYNRWVRENRSFAMSELELSDSESMSSTQLSLEARLDLDRNFRALPPSSRELLSRYAHGYTLGEIADELGLTPKAVEWRIHKIRGNRE